MPITNIQKLKEFEAALNAIDYEELDELDHYFELLGNSENVEAKKMLADTYYFWCDTIQMDFEVGNLSGEGWGMEMLKWIDNAKQLNPSEHKDYYYGDAYLFEYLLSENNSNQNDLLIKAMHSFEGYLIAHPNAIYPRLRLAFCLFEKMEATENYEESIFNQILSLYTKSLSCECQLALDNHFEEYHAQALVTFLYSTFELYFLPFANNHSTFLRFKENIDQLIHQFAEKDLRFYAIHLIYLDKLKEHLQYFIKDAKLETNQFTEPFTTLNIDIVETMNMITKYQFEDKETFLSLGRLFAKVAKENNNYKFHQYALNYYTKSKDLSTSTAYCTANVLKEIAMLCLESGEIEEAREAFNKGRKLYLEAEKHEEHPYFLYLHQGDFLLEYARFAPQADQPKLLNEAIHRYTKAIDLEKQYTDRPYLGLGKAYLKLGEDEKCLNILQECKHLFSNEDYEYNLKELKKDQSFEKIDDWLSTQ